MGCFAQKKGVVNHHPFNKTSFLNFFYARCRPPHPRLAPYTPEVEASAPQRTRNGCTSQTARQTTQGTTHTPKRWTRCTGLHSIPDRPRRVDRTGGGRAVCPIGHAQTGKIIVNKNIHFLCVNLLTKEIKLFTI